MLKTCPACGRVIPPALRVTGKRRQQMLEYVSCHPEGVTCWQIIDHVYADDPDGGPSGHNVISVMARRINKQIVPQGFRVRGSGGPGSTYTLVKL